MRIRILTRPENALANLNHQITNKKAANEALRRNSLANANVSANEMRKFRPRSGNALRMEKFATTFASECECDGLVHSVLEHSQPKANIPGLVVRGLNVLEEQPEETKRFVGPREDALSQKALDGMGLNSTYTPVGNSYLPILYFFQSNSVKTYRYRYRSVIISN